MAIDYKDICLKLADISQTTGRALRESREKETPEAESKGKNDFVTKFDKQTEATLVRLLSKLLPESGFIAEENSSDKVGKKYNWIIDPIDGTTNFIHGLFPYCISIALMEGKELVAGVVYEAGLDECFYAWKGGGAFLNGREIRVSKASKVADSLIATGFPYTNFSKMDQFIESLNYFMQNSHGMRRLGSAAADLAYVACGRIDAFYEYDLKAWDVAAGAFIIQEAGGSISDFSGGGNYLFGRQIVAANSLVFDEMQTIVGSFLK